MNGRYFSYEEGYLITDSIIVDLETKDRFEISNAVDPSISANGRYVSYMDDSGSGIYIYKVETGESERVSTVGSEPTISQDGNFVLYKDLDNLYLYNRLTKETEQLNIDGEGNSRTVSRYSISGNGRYVALRVRGQHYSEDEYLFKDLVEKETRTVTGGPFTNPIGEGSSTNTIDGNFFQLSENGKYLYESTSYRNSIYKFDVSQEFPSFIDEEWQNEPQMLLTEVHRFFQYQQGYHLYTSDLNEIDHIKAKSETGELAYNHEAEQYRVLADNKDLITGEELEGVRPIHRFFNTDTGVHLYTMDENEKNVIQDSLPHFNYEGITYYAFASEPENLETIPVYRMYNNTSGAHLYSTDQNEIDYIQENLAHFSMENYGNAVFHVFEL